jgi:hypothetical protein
VDEDAVLPDEDTDNVPEQELRKKESQREDEQLHRAVEVLKNHKA